MTMKKNTIAMLLATVLCFNTVSIPALADNTDMGSIAVSATEETEASTVEKTESDEYGDAEEPQNAMDSEGVVDPEDSEESSTESVTAIEAEEEISEMMPQDEGTGSGSETFPTDKSAEDEDKEISEDDQENEIPEEDEGNETPGEGEENEIPEKDITETVIQEEGSNISKAEQVSEFTYEKLDDSNISITGYTGSDTSLIIPGTIDGYTVKEIGSFALNGRGDITELTIPDGVTTIGTCALNNCTGLTELKLPGSLEMIDYSALKGCTGLTALELPDSVTEIGFRALSNCTNLESVNYPKSLIEAGGNIFEGDTKLTRIEVPEGVTELPKDVFSYCANFTEIILPSTLSKIGNSAMTGCTGLTELTIPDSVTVIGDYALRNCTGLTELKLSGSLETIGFEAMSGCTGLTALELPNTVTEIEYRALSNCTNLKSVNYPKSLIKAGGNTFEGDTKLTGIEVPEGVTELPKEVFSNCANFTEIILPSTLSKIGDSAMTGCTGLTELTIPDSVTTIGMHALSNCTGLTELKLSSSLEVIGYSALSGCTGLKSIYIPNSVDQIGYYAFDGCTGLTTVTIADSLTSLTSLVFSNCPKLVKVYIPDSVVSIDPDAFYNSDRIVFYCSYLSYATMYAIENNIPFVSTSTYIDSENSVLDRGVTAYYGDFNGMSANGHVAMTIQYGIKESSGSDVSDMEVEVELPNGVDLDESTLRVDGKPVDDYTFDYGRKLTVPVTNTFGIIRFYIKVLSHNTVSSFAALRFEKDGSASQEVIGIINEDVPVFTIEAPENISKNTFSVTGAAPASGTIRLQVGNGETVTVQASKAGNWKAILTINDPKDHREYKINAVCTPPSGPAETRTASVTYIQGEPTLNSLNLTYSENNEIKSYDLSENDRITPVIYYQPGKEFVFEASFENPDKIDELYITSTRNNVTKYLPAEFDPKKGVFVASGFFDENNPYYVPGVISYAYNKKAPEVAVGQDVDWKSYTDALPAGAADGVDVTVNTDTEYNASIDLSKLSGDLSGVFIDAGISVIDAGSGTDLGKWKDLLEENDKVLSYVVPGYNDDKYICNLDYSDTGTLLMLVKDVSGNRYIRLGLDLAKEGETDLTRLSKLSDISSTLSTVNQVSSLLLSEYQIEKDMEELRQEVISSGQYSSTEELNSALKKVDELENDQTKFLILTTVLPMMVSSPVAIGATMSAAPAILFTAMLGAIIAASSFCWDFRKAEIKGGKYRARFIIDPSGTVYDIDTGESLKDVTTTAYWIENDDSVDFWDNKPEDSEYGTLWDAEEYNQGNPLLTNIDGKYAWDVPEGWWRVKYEKEGYETAWSEWMTVPPIRTEINIGLKSTTPRTIKLDDSTEVSGISDRVYTGKEIEQTITVKHSNNELTENTDYTVEYEHNIDTGTASVKITGIGKYTGTITKTFTILPGKTTRGDMFNLANNVKVTWKEVPGAKYYKVYREGVTDKKESRKEPVIVTAGLVGWDKDPGLTNGHAYRYKIVASLTGKGDPSGDSPLSYSKLMYRLKTVVIRSVKNTAPGKVTVKYDKSTSGDSYVLQYCERQDMVGAKTKVVLGANNTSYVIGGLKKGKTYYISIRVRKKVNGIDYYTTFGVAKKVTITK